MFDRRKLQGDDGLLSSSLLDQDKFYARCVNDLARARREVVIESPFLSFRRINYLLPELRRLIRRKVNVIVNTKPPEELDGDFAIQAQKCIALLQELGVKVLVTGGHHRKLAIIDRQILYEGSLNILSQNDSCEIMRRIESATIAEQMISFIKLNKFLG